jgi:hypothetical protein
MILNAGIAVLFLVTCPAEDRLVSLQKKRIPASRGIESKMRYALFGYASFSPQQSCHVFLKVPSPKSSLS